MKHVKIGCIGAGFALEGMYGPILRYMEAGRLEAVADRDPARLKWAEQTLGIQRTYSSVDEMLAEKSIDAVIIALPIQQHEQCVMKAVQAGKHVFCEKPMGRTVEECDRMIAACAAKGLQLMVGFQKRFNKSMMLAKSIIEQGRIGEVFLVEAKWTRPFPVMNKDRIAVEEHVGWRHEADTRGGIFQDMGSHTVDLCRWWLGDIAEVSGELAIVDANEQTEDTVAVTCRHTNGAIALHWIAYVHEVPIEEYRVHGSTGTLSVSIDRSRICVTQDPFDVRIHRNSDSIEIVTPPTC
jgi:predicted dehydrogenase